jgi:hypothetical protein
MQDEERFKMGNETELRNYNNFDDDRLIVGGVLTTKKYQFINFILA